MRVKLYLYLAIVLGYIGWALMVPARLLGMDYTEKAKATIKQAKTLLEGFR